MIKRRRMQCPPHGSDLCVGHAQQRAIQRQFHLRPTVTVELVQYESSRSRLVDVAAQWLASLFIITPAMPDAYARAVRRQFPDAVDGPPFRFKPVVIAPRRNCHRRPHTRLRDCEGLVDRKSETDESQPCRPGRKFEASGHCAIPLKIWVGSSRQLISQNRAAILEFHLIFLRSQFAGRRQIRQSASKVYPGG